jgi:hypothetical protein
MTQPQNGKATGLDEFRRLLRDVKQLWAWGAAAAAVPFLANFLSLAPPWPVAIPYLTALVELITLILVFQFLKRSPRRSINRVIATSTVVLFGASLIYLGLLAEFTFETPSRTREIKGFICGREAMKVFEDKCPWLGLSELSHIEYQPRSLWVSWSVSAMAIFLNLLWLLCFMMLSAVLGSFAVYQRRVVSKG